MTAVSRRTAGTGGADSKGARPARAGVARAARWTGVSRGSARPSAERASATDAPATCCTAMSRAADPPSGAAERVDGDGAAVTAGVWGRGAVRPG
ncbi:hypothetical protein DN051_03745 [Streptomyces cadmiisoli]|uniref:Uncharacterized protein n=1 Tax=Streptomyces cadmiisoli TaxID=2184053 RepID=A0A2Z4IUG0_9ACTN|nr:hypothetical protein DN051_03745 [Streptomyces cadmiisoli]